MAILSKTYYFEYFSSYRESGRIITYSKPYNEEENEEENNKNEDKNEDEDEDGDESEGGGDIATMDAFKIKFESIKKNDIYICELHDECDPYIDTFNFYADIEGIEDDEYIEDEYIEDEYIDDDCNYYGNIIYKTKRTPKNRYKFYQKVFKQVNGYFITEYPYDEETMIKKEKQVDKLRGLPKKMLDHIKDNLDCRYFMVAFNSVGAIIFNEVIYPK